MTDEIRPEDDLAAGGNNDGDSGDNDYTNEDLTGAPEDETVADIDMDIDGDIVGGGYDDDDSQEAIVDVKEKSVYRELLEVVVIAVVLAFILRIFIITPYYIPSESMLPALEINDKILVSRLNYHFTEPKRGEVVVFHYPRNVKTVFVKRCIAVSGETVEGRDSVLYINGEAVPEDYLPEGLRFSNFGPTVVPEGSYFMLGDNRNNSDDSRSWGFVDKKLLIGKAVIRIWPPDRAGLVR